MATAQGFEAISVAFTVIQALVRAQRGTDRIDEQGPAPVLDFHFVHLESRGPGPIAVHPNLQGDTMHRSLGHHLIHLVKTIHGPITQQAKPQPSEVHGTSPRHDFRITVTP